MPGPGRHRREDRLPSREPGWAWAELLRRYNEEPPRVVELWRPELHTLPTSSGDPPPGTCSTCWGQRSCWARWPCGGARRGRSPESIGTVSADGGTQP